MRHLLFSALLAFGLVAALSSCAGAPSPAADGKSTIEAKLVDMARITSMYGPAQALNPFIAPRSLVGKSPYEFVVVQLDTPKSSPGLVAIDARIVNSDGRELASMLDLQEMTELWTLWPDSDEKMAKRQERLEGKYLPARELTIRGGRSYWAVISGENPIARPARIVVTITYQGMQPSVFEFELPSLVTK